MMKRAAPLWLVLLLFCTIPMMGLYTSITSSVPTGSILMTNNGSCPAGFLEVTAMRGYYPVGLVSGGTSGSSHGTALTVNEARAAGAHTHGTSFQATTDTASGGQNAGLGSSGTRHPTDSFGSADGYAAPYYYVQFCSKS